MPERRWQAFDSQLLARTRLAVPQFFVHISSPSPCPTCYPCYFYSYCNLLFMCLLQLKRKLVECHSGTTATRLRVLYFIEVYEASEGSILNKALQNGIFSGRFPRKGLCCIYNTIWRTLKYIY